MTEQVHTNELVTHAAVVEAEAERRMQVRLSPQFESIGPDYNLLQGFYFSNQVSPVDHPAISSLRLPPLAADQLFENWWYKGVVDYYQKGNIRIAECQDYTMANVQVETAPGTDFRDQTRQVYHELLSAVRATSHPKLTRMWNYFGDITSGEDDFEKYRQFSIGRAEAFEDMGIVDIEVPTGTAIGSEDGSGLSIIVLASNHEFYAVENPRQVSAFNYPRRYGPRSPKFSRGGYVASNCHKLFLISGTAAVVGHESSFPYNTKLQSEETFRNLECLCDTISGLVPGGSKFELDKNSILRVYLKDPADFDAVAQQVCEQFNIDRNRVAFLRGTICRKELTVEIDAIKVI